MKALLAILIFTALALGHGLAAPKKAAAQDDATPTVEEQTLPRWVVILGVYKDFAEAKANAQKIAKASGVPFSMNGNIFDKKGLRLPDDADDPTWAGQYLARRGNTAHEAGKDLEEHISIEKSAGYEGFAKGFYIVVGTIAETKEAGLAQEERFKAAAPGTYVKKTRIYMGCIH